MSKANGVTQKTLQKERLNGDEFAPFLRQLNIPKAKQLKDKTSIDFTYPITAIVGANGTHKSTILRFLQGCFNGENFGAYFFNAGLDVVYEGNRFRFWYKYVLPSGGEAQCITTRISSKRKNGKIDPDYFETSRPILGDGMDKLPEIEDTPDEDKAHRTDTRWRKLDKSVVYIDSRKDIPAYDIFWLIDDGGLGESRTAMKDRLRRRAKQVSQTVEANRVSHVYNKKERIVEPPRILTKKETSLISKILGKRYTEISLLKHTYFGNIGTTVRLAAQGVVYSEAYAGSGEYSVVMIVHRICSAPNYSMVLLDEPEVSLHPLAQANLMSVLEILVIEKHLQIVFSTHSPEMIRDLPAKAIKVFRRDEVTGEVDLVSNATHARDAFTILGVNPEKITICVEDELAAALVRNVLDQIGLEENGIELKPLGGAETILSKHIPVWALSGQQVLVVLDGDKRPHTQDGPDASESSMLDKLERYGVTRKALLPDGGNAPNEQQILEQAEIVLEWIEKNCLYMGTSCPEQLLLEMGGEASLASSAFEAKMHWVKMAREAYYPNSVREPNADDILSVQRMHIGKNGHDSGALKEFIPQIQAWLSKDGK